MPFDDMTDLFEKMIDGCVAGVEGFGTAFFVNNDTLLTCAHVVQGRSTVRLWPFRTQREKVARVDPDALLPVDAGDLALLRIEDPDDDQPAVLLHLLAERSELTARPVTVAGYPHDNWAEPGYEPRRVSISGRWRAVSDPAKLIFAATDEITRGMSGAPVLDLATGTVVGITQYRKGSEGVSGNGGGAIPMLLAVRSFPLVRQLYERPPAAARLWLDCRDRRGLSAIGREPKGTTGQLDLRLSGAMEEWAVNVGDDAGSATRIKLEALDVNVSRAVFQWTRGRRTSSSDDLKLVGDILSAALLHGQAGQSYAEWRAAADDLMVRLVTDPAGELAAVPWEYAKPPPAGSESLGLDEHVQLVRVAPQDGPDRYVAPEARPRVVSIVVQPDPTPFPKIRPPGVDSISWPDCSQVAESVSQVLGNPFDVTLVCNPTPYELDELASGGSCAVLHYQGFAKTTSAVSQLGVLDYLQNLSWVSIDDLAKVAKAVQAKVVVIEHSAAPQEYVPDDSDPRFAGPLLDAGVLAVVTTRFPVHPKQAEIFNRRFYQLLAGGETIEHAVQLARRAVSRNDPFADQTIFGAFVLWTRGDPGLRLVAGPERPDADETQQALPATLGVGFTAPVSRPISAPRDTSVRG